MKQLKLDLDFNKVTVPQTLKQMRDQFLTPFGFDKIITPAQAATVNTSGLRSLESAHRDYKKRKTTHYYGFLPMRNRRFASSENNPQALFQVLQFSPFFSSDNNFDYTPRTSVPFTDLKKTNSLKKTSSTISFHRSDLDVHTTLTLDGFYITSTKDGYSVSLFINRRSSEFIGNTFKLLDPRISSIKFHFHYEIKTLDNTFPCIDYKNSYMEYYSHQMPKPLKMKMQPNLQDPNYVIYWNQIFVPLFSSALKSFFSSRTCNDRHHDYIDFVCASLKQSHQRLIVNRSELLKSFEKMNSQVDAESYQFFFYGEMTSYSREAIFTYIQDHTHHLYMKYLHYANNSFLRDLFGSDPDQQYLPSDLHKFKSNHESFVDSVHQTSLHSYILNLYTDKVKNIPLSNAALAKTIQVVKTDRFTSYIKTSNATFNSIKKSILSLTIFYALAYNYYSHDPNFIEEHFPSSLVLDIIPGGIASNLMQGMGYDYSHFYTLKIFPIAPWLAFEESPHRFSFQKMRRFFYESFYGHINHIFTSASLTVSLNDLGSIITNIKKSCDKLNDEKYDFASIVNWRNLNSLEIAHNELSKAQTNLRYPNLACKNKIYSDLQDLDHNVPGTTLKVIFAPDTNTVRNWGTTQRHCIGNYSDYINKSDFIVFGVWDNTKDDWYGHCIHKIAFDANKKVTGFTPWQFYGLHNSPLPEDEKKIVCDFVFDLLFIQKQELIEQKKKLEQTATQSDEFSTLTVSKGSQLVTV